MASFLWCKKAWRRSLVLDAMRRNGPVSRIGIARALGFNTQTVTRVVDELVNENLVIEQPTLRNAIGRPPTPLVLNDNARCVLGIDIGLQVTTALFMNLAGTVLSQCVVPTSEVTEVNALLRHVEKFARALHENGPPPLAGIGVALVTYTSFRPGPSGPILSVEADRIRDGLEKLFRVPVLVQDDSLMLALGELWFGEQADLRTFAAVNISDGLGAGLVIDRRVYNGSRGYVGDLGHLQLNQEEIPCVCGCTHCLDKVASGSALLRMSTEEGLLSNGTAQSLDQLAQMARDGNAQAKAIFRRFGQGLAIGVGALLTLLGPEAVIIGGRVSRFSDLFMKPLLEELPKQTIPSYLQASRIIVSKLHETAIPLGTGACVLNQIFGISGLSSERII